MKTSQLLDSEFMFPLSYTNTKILEKPIKKTAFLKIFALHSGLCAVIFNVTLVGFIYCFRENLMKLLFQWESSHVIFVVTAEVFVFWRRQEGLVEVWKWCKSRHSIEDPELARIGRPFFLKALEHTEAGMKGLKVAFLFAFSLCSFGITTLKFFVEQNPLPLPFPHHVFGIPVTGGWSFAFNLWIQVFGVAFNVLHTCIFHMWLFVAFIHVFASLEATQYAVESKDDIVDELGFHEWLRIVHIFLTDSSSYFYTVGEIASLVIYVEQKTMFTVLFVTWLTIKIDRTNLPNSAAFFFFVVFVFLICVINEAFKQKYEDITFAFYKLRWYDMEPKESRLLIPLMVAAQNHPVLKAGGLDEMTFANFLKYIKGAYSTAILMEEILFA